MKVLVTGGAGFIGSTITDLLISKGHSVSVLDNFSTGKRSNLNKKAKLYVCDIRNVKKTADIFSREKFDLVCHHAAQIDVRKSVEDPVYDANTNIIGSINVLENAARTKVKKIIFSSSGGTIYGECGKTPPDESKPGRPVSPYGITKYAVEFYLNYYNLVHGLKYTILRYGNVYGPRQDPHGEAGVVAIFAGRMLSNKDIFIFGDGKQLRDYVFVKDVALANNLALTRGDNQIINIGTGQSLSVNMLFKKMAVISGYMKKPLHKPARPGELFRNSLNIAKAARVLGWKPSVNFDEGIKQTIDYFRNNIGVI